MRLQLALNVKNLDSAIAYYSKMFDTEPHKIRKGYANFAIDNPALKLVLFENPDADESLNHLGVELFDSDDIGKTSKRFEDAGILVHRFFGFYLLRGIPMWSQDVVGTGRPFGLCGGLAWLRGVVLSSLR